MTASATPPFSSTHLPTAIWSEPISTLPFAKAQAGGKLKAFGRSFVHARSCSKSRQQDSLHVFNIRKLQNRTPVWLENSNNLMLTNAFRWLVDAPRSGSGSISLFLAPLLSVLSIRFYFSILDHVEY